MKSAAKVTGEWERRAQEGTTDQGGGAGQLCRSIHDMPLTNIDSDFEHGGDDSLDW